MRFFTLLLVLFLTSCTHTAPIPYLIDAQENPPIPIHWLHTGDIGGLPLVDVEIQGINTRWLVDTGSATHVVSIELVKQLQLSKIGETEVESVGGRQKVGLFKISELKTGGWVFSNITAAGLPLDSYNSGANKQISGILGIPAFQNLNVNFNFSESNLVLSPDDETSISSSHTIPIQLIHGVPIVKARINNLPEASFIFDTGNAGAVVLFDHYARKRSWFKQLHAFPVIKSEELDNPVTAHLALAKAVNVGSVESQNVTVSIVSLPKAIKPSGFGQIAGSLGNALFQNSGISLHTQTKRLSILSEKAIKLPGGFGIIYHPNSTVVRHIITNSPAAEAGILAGDRLKAINRKKSLTHPAEIWEYLKNLSHADFTFTRREKQFKVRLHRAYFLPQLPVSAQ